MTSDSFYRKHGVEPPKSIPHGITPEELAEKLKPLKLSNWRQEGNRLIADTPMGPLVNVIPTDYLLTGIDDNNLPVLTKIEQK